MPVGGCGPRLDSCNASRYTAMDDALFRDKDAQRLWDRQRVRRLGPDVQRSALKRLARLDAAESLDDLRAFPGNRLERLRGDRAGQHSIRINDQWRICFVWTDAGPEDVEIVDYH